MSLLQKVKMNVELGTPQNVDDHGVMVSLERYYESHSLARHIHVKSLNRVDNVTTIIFGWETRFPNILPPKVIYDIKNKFGAGLISESYQLQQ